MNDASARIQAALDVLNQRFFGSAPKRQRKSRSVPAATPADHAVLAAQWRKAEAKHRAAGKLKHADLCRRAAEKYEALANAEGRT